MQEVSLFEKFRTSSYTYIARRGSRLSLVSFYTQSNSGKVLAKKKPTCNLESSNIQNSNSPYSSHDFKLK